MAMHERVLVRSGGAGSTGVMGQRQWIGAEIEGASQRPELTHSYPAAMLRFYR